MRKWAYCVKVWDWDRDCEEDERELDELGNEGWELVSIIYHADQIVAYLKRPAAMSALKDG